MKKTLYYLLGLMLLILVTSAAPANIVKSYKAVKSKLVKNNDVDEYYFAYKATSIGGGNYDLTLYLYLYDETTGSASSGTAAVNVNISINSGPLAGYNFYFPMAAKSVDYGDFYLGSAPTGSIAASTSPMEMLGTPIAQEIVNVNQYP